MTTPEENRTSFVLLMGGPAPADTMNICGQVYHLFAPVNVIPELILHTALPGPEQAPQLMSRHGHVFLNFYGSGRTKKWWRLLRLFQLQYIFARPSPREVAARIRQLDRPRVVIILGAGHDLIVYSLLLLRLLPQVPATFYLTQELEESMSRYRNPLSKAVIRRALPYLFRRCDRRFVCSEPFRRLYEAKYGLPFGVALPSWVRDDYLEAFGKPEVTWRRADGEFRVFLTGSMSPIFYPSLRCLARAFRLASRELQKKLTLVFAGTWTSEALQQVGFAQDQLEGLGWLPSKYDLLKRSSEADCTFLTFFLDASYKTVLWDFPTRISDFLIAGPPMIVHATRNSSVGQYFEENGLPFLCDDLDEQAMAAHLVRVAKLNNAEREGIRQRYLSIVKRVHLASRIRQALLGQE